MTLALLRAAVEARLHAGASFDDVETLIDTAPGLTSDARAAAWLFAWSRVDAAEQRRIADDYVALIIAGERPPLTILHD